MRKSAMLLTSVLAATIAFAGCDQQQQAGPAKSQAAEDPKIKAVKDSIAKMTPEETAVVEKVKAMKPELNGLASGRPLSEEINDYATTKGAFNIIPVGWTASRKTASGREKRWKVIFNYQDFKKQFVTAEWEYDPDTNKVYPFDQENARIFWSNPPQETKTAKGK